MLRLLIIPGLPIFTILLSDLMAPLPLAIGLPLLFLILFIVSCFALFHLITARRPL
jgi:hypothetical protein